MNLCCQYKVDSFFKPRSFNSKAKALALHQHLALGEKSSKNSIAASEVISEILSHPVTHCGGHSSYRQPSENDSVGPWPVESGCRLGDPDCTEHLALGIQGHLLPFSPRGFPQ